MSKRTSHHIDPNATAHDLLNDATEWLQYGKGLTELLADLMHEAESVRCRKMALALESIAAMNDMGVQCLAEAHARVTMAAAPKGTG